MLALATVAVAAERRTIVRSDDELLLLALKLDPFDLDLTLPSYPGPDGGTLVPLGALAQALDIAIHVDPEAGVAQGFVIQERRRFRLSSTSDSAWVAGAPRPFPSDQVEWQADDAYVDTRLLADWLPLDLTVDRHGSALTVRPREPLPIQQRLERERTSARVPVPDSAGVEGERLQAPYRPWGWPASDHTLQLDQRHSAPGSTAGFQYTTQATADLFYLEAHGFATGDDRDALRDGRLSLGRRDPDPVLLGPLGAREVMIGDVLDPGLEMVSVASAGRGALLSSFPLFEETEYDRRTFQGELPPGWDVELYRNDALIGYRQAGSGPRYEFIEVPLLYGLNQFRLQFYGPQGQTRTEIQTVHLGQSLTPPGRAYYRVTAQRHDDHELDGRAELTAGLWRQVSMTARLASIQRPDSDRTYEGLGVRVAWDRVFVKTDAVLGPRRGHAIQAALATRLGPVGVWGQHARLTDFQSNVFLPTFGPIVSRSGVRLDLDLRPARGPRLPTTVEWRHDDLLQGSVHDLVHQVSVAGRGVSLSNRFQWRFVRLDGVSPPVERRGALLVHRNLRRLSLRGAVEYDFDRGGELRDIGLTAESQRFGPLIAAEIRRTVHTRETSARLSLTREYGSLGVALRSDVSSATGGGVSALLSISLDRDPITRHWHADARPRSESGTVAAQVFLDADGDGARGPGDEPLEGVRLRATPGGSEARTDADGVAVLRGFPSAYRSEIALVTSSLEDPLRIPRRRDVAILPRSGSMLLVDFPVVACGEIAGTVRVRRAGATHALAGARLELVAVADGRVVKRARSAFDGYYDIAAVPPGRYRLYAMPPGTLARDATPTSIPIEIDAGGPILEGLDLTLAGVPQQVADEDER
jgi:hypothetical protein